MNLRRHPIILVLPLVLVACGTGANVSVGQPRPEMVPPAERGAPTPIDAFLRQANSDLVEACNEVLATVPKGDAPPSTAKSLEINGFDPVVGPMCEAGYVLDRPPVDETGSMIVPAALEVRDRPDPDGVVVGYVVPGTPGWVSLEQLEAADLTLDDILAGLG